MNNCNFMGRLAKAAIYRKGPKKGVAYFTLIQNEYAGKDENNDTKTRRVAIPFTAFSPLAESIAEMYDKGDQLAVTYHVNNNERSAGNGDQTEHGFSFIIDTVTPGAYGEITRQRLAQQQKEA